jgi:formate hydrogenlyase transcriptional activator
MFSVSVFEAAYEPDAKLAEPAAAYRGHARTDNADSKLDLKTDAIVGESAALKTVLQQVNLVAPTDATVLILGETGTGKELVARAIHAQSRRASRPFVRVNCAAIPASLIAAELFGHEKGAFTGALQRRLGRFEAADGGTIFLDEVGELPLETQVMLLRVLQEREFERIGSSHPVEVDVRVIAATNRDLSAAVKEGTFRRDMFYRLNVFPIRLPALRERLEDIPTLVDHLMRRYAAKAGKSVVRVARRTIEALQSYEWPGNIRELQNIVERAVILSQDGTLTVDESWVRLDTPRAGAAGNRLSASLAEREKEMIEAALADSRGRVSGPSGAAIRLGIPRQTLDSKIASLRISKKQFKEQPAA